MWFYCAGYLTLTLSTLTVIVQLAYMPLIVRRVENSRDSVRQSLQGFKTLMEDIDVFLESDGRERRSAVLCSAGKPGTPGTPGKDGIPGVDGPSGARGKDARDILEEQEEKCVICPTGEMGPIGPPGDRGEPGEKGQKGPPGIPSIDGSDGDIGIEGDVGPAGYPGRPGAPGPSGRSAEGGIGQPGPKGADGPVGRAGAQGPRGKRNYIYGLPGPVGQPGPSGLDGMNGNIGERGAKGPPGEKGADAKFCPCPLELHILSELKKKSLAEISKPSTVISTSNSIKSDQMDDDNLNDVSDKELNSELDRFERPTPFHQSQLHSRTDMLFRSAPPAIQSKEVGPPGQERYPSEIRRAPVLREASKSTTEIPLELENIPKRNTFPARAWQTSHLMTTTSQTIPGTSGSDGADETLETPEEMVDIPKSFGSDSSSDQEVLVEVDDYANDDYDDTTTIRTTTRRRFVYITKKPRIVV